MVSSPKRMKNIRLRAKKLRSIWADRNAPLGASQICGEGGKTLRLSAGLGMQRGFMGKRKDS
jgi:hypothetical protein